MTYRKYNLLFIAGIVLFSGCGKKQTPQQKAESLYTSTSKAYHKELTLLKTEKNKVVLKQEIEEIILNKPRRNNSSFLQSIFAFLPKGHYHPYSLYKDSLEKDINRLKRYKKYASNDTLQDDITLLMSDLRKLSVIVQNSKEYINEQRHRHDAFTRDLNHMQMMSSIRR